MKIGFCFYGITYGTQSTKGFKDYRHCWTNIHEMLVQPFIDNGHEANIYVTTYPFSDPDIEQEFYATVKPEKIHFCEFEGSDPFTCKGAFDAFQNENLDFIILTRFDIHFHKVLFNENIDYTKFNFLYPETGGFWWDILRWTTDNAYMWPMHLTNQVHQSLHYTYRNLRPESADTHPLIHKLALSIGHENIHFISNIPEPSDESSFYTLCTKGRDIERAEHVRKYGIENTPWTKS
jgi:hypothetical protein